MVGHIADTQLREAEAKVCVVVLDREPTDWLVGWFDSRRTTRGSIFMW
jgi:phenylpyruvate tautomerase PptA (4-oxalocrotonate tautomerase family)